MVMANFLTCIISNTYFGENKLQSTYQDKINIEKLFKNNCISLHDLDKKKILTKLEIIKSTKISYLDTALIFITGHGAFDSGNNLESFATNDLDTIYINEIISYFVNYKKIFVIINTCQVIENNKQTKLIKLPKTSKIIICCPVSKKLSALGNKNTGGYFISALLKTFHQIDIGKYISCDYFLLILSLCFQEYSRIGLVPKFYVNKLVRDNNTTYAELLKHTNQSEKTIAMTRTNNNIIDIIIRDKEIDIKNMKKYAMTREEKFDLLMMLKSQLDLLREKQIVQ